MKKLSVPILCCASIIAMFAVYCKCIDNALDKSLARIEKQYKEQDKEDKSESDHQ